MLEITIEVTLCPSKELIVPCLGKTLYCTSESSLTACEYVVEGLKRERERERERRDRVVFTFPHILV